MDLQELLASHFTAGGNMRRTIMQGGVTIDGTVVRDIEGVCVDLDEATRIKVGHRVVYDRCMRDLEDEYKSNPTVHRTLNIAADLETPYEETMRIAVKALAHRNAEITRNVSRGLMVDHAETFQALAGTPKKPSRSYLYGAIHGVVWNFVDDEDEMPAVLHSLEEKLAAKIADAVEDLF